MNLDANRIRLIMELRKLGITNSDVLRAIEQVPREIFVPQTFQDQAYENTALPIGHGQTISQPAIVAYMTQELRLEPRMKVLEIGTGSGYQAAVLSRLCRRLYSIERHGALLNIAEERLRLIRANNITAIVGDGSKGWPEQAPFNRIIITAAAKGSIPEKLLEQLSMDGIMIAPVGKTDKEQHLYRFSRGENGQWISEMLWPVRFVPLVFESGGKELL